MDEEQFIRMERLRFYVEKRLQTTMIGALSKFEDNFGYLWGHNVENEEDLTPEQVEFYDMWERTRNQILNQGNNQIRNLKEDFSKWGHLCLTKYSYTFRCDPEESNTCDKCRCPKK